MIEIMTENRSGFRVDMTSTAFLKDDWKEKLAQCRKYCESIHWEFGVQLHNTAPAEQIKALAAEKIPLSADLSLRGL